MRIDNIPDNSKYTGDGFNTPNYYDEKNPEPTPIDNYIKDISNTLSELLKGIDSDFNIEPFPDNWNKAIHKGIAKGTTSKNIEKGIISILKYGVNTLSDKLDSSLNKTNSGENDKDNNSKSKTQQQIEKLCGKKCKVKTFGDTETEVVKSVIKFGE